MCHYYHKQFFVYADVCYLDKFEIGSSENIKKNIWSEEILKKNRKFAEFK